MSLSHLILHRNAANKAQPPSVPPAAMQGVDAHPAYDAMIESRLNTWANAHPGYTPLAAFNELNEIIEQVRVAIAANPTTHINDIIP